MYHPVRIAFWGLVSLAATMIIHLTLSNELASTDEWNVANYAGHLVMYCLIICLILLFAVLCEHGNKNSNADDITICVSILFIIMTLIVFVTQYVLTLRGSRNTYMNTLLLNTPLTHLYILISLTLFDYVCVTIAELLNCRKKNIKTN